MTSDEETVRYGNRVILKYSMKVQLPDGSFEKREQEGVMEFIYGVERQAQSLEDVILGAKKGDRFSVHIPAQELYGERDRDLIKEIPKQGLIKQRVRQGKYYRQIKKGQLISFKVLEIRPDSILADFNPPMAGVSALVDCEILDVKKASEEEIIRAKESEAKRKIGCE